MRCLRVTRGATSVGLAPQIAALQTLRTINIFILYQIYESHHIDSVTITTISIMYIIT